MVGREWAPVANVGEPWQTMAALWLMTRTFCGCRPTRRTSRPTFRMLALPVEHFSQYAAKHEIRRPHCTPGMEIIDSGG
jgi:hypothetical protein